MPLVCVLGIGLLFGASSPERIQRAAQAVLADEQVQSEFPGVKEAQAPEVKPEAPVSEGARDASRILVWLAAGVFLVLTLVWLATRLGAYQADVGRVATPGAGAARAPPPPGEPVEADALAREGRFAEAVHALLLHAFGHLAAHTSVAGSLTSREVLGAVEMPAGARQAAGALVDEVERSIFAARPTEAETYRVAREHYVRFDRALEPRPA
jgi:hypothetical protein